LAAEVYGHWSSSPASSNLVTAIHLCHEGGRKGGISITLQAYGTDPAHCSTVRLINYLQRHYSQIGSALTPALHAQICPCGIPAVCNKTFSNEWKWICA
jgi:hypothetical protein